ncbi:MAG TPA: hypothetical protein VEC93_22480, partial [Anaerolineae bacterium]|nr:hypothetical protein [Anaerolineae bacterium]
NSDLVGGQPLEKFNLGEDIRRRHIKDPFYWGHNEKARETLLLDFIEGRPSPSHFATHAATNKLLSKIYECIVSEQRGGLPHMVFEI